VVVSIGGMATTDGRLTAGGDAPTRPRRRTAGKARPRAGEGRGAGDGKTRDSIDDVVEAACCVGPAFACATVVSTAPALRGVLGEGADRRGCASGEAPQKAAGSRHTVRGGGTGGGGAGEGAGERASEARMTPRNRMRSMETTWLVGIVPSAHASGESMQLVSPRKSSCTFVPSGFERW